MPFCAILNFYAACTWIHKTVFHGPSAHLSASPSLPSIKRKIGLATLQQLSDQFEIKHVCHAIRIGTSPMIQMTLNMSHYLQYGGSKDDLDWRIDFKYLNLI